MGVLASGSMQENPEGRRRPRLGLAMIVKNESAVIERCLTSVKPLVGTWTIVDTGSNDDTISRIRAALDGIPGTLYERAWTDFGTNRSELMTLARGTADHLLLIDADMTLRVEGDLPELGDHDYLVRHSGAMTYKIPRVVRGDVAWHFVGATHEYLDAEGEAPITRVLDELVIVDHADGGSRSDKFTRDRDLLERAVADDPGNARNVFYLAQTYADLGMVDDAIRMYRSRIELGGWEEECFWSQLQIGRLLVDRDVPLAVTELLAAHERRPTRSEPLYELARCYRIREAHHSAALFARAGRSIPFPEEDLLFVEREPYDWGLDFELSIATYWIGDFAESLRLSESLLDGRAPEWLAPWVRHNRAEAERAALRGPGSTTPAAALLASSVPGVRFTRLAPSDDDPDTLWSLFNPSIANGPNGLALTLRRSNYVRDAQGLYHSRDGSSTITTRNRFRLLDDAGATISEHRLPEVPEGAPTFPSSVRGVEDLRLIWLRERWYALGTCRDRDPHMRCRMVLWDLGADGHTPGTLQLLNTGLPERHEKNWMPFVADDALHVVYGIDPLVVLRLDPATGRTEPVTGDVEHGQIRSLRGGSQGCEVATGRWRFVVHEVFDDGAGRAYVHRIIDIARADTDNFEVVAATPPFVFTGAAVEFCAGLTLDGEDLVLSIGVDDAQSLLVRVPSSEVDDWMLPVSP